MTDAEFIKVATKVLRDKGASDINIQRGTIDGESVLDVRCKKGFKEWQLAMVGDSPHEMMMTAIQSWD